MLSGIVDASATRGKTVEQTTVKSVKRVGLIAASMTLVACGFWLRSPQVKEEDFAVPFTRLQMKEDESLASVVFSPWTRKALDRPYRDSLILERSGGYFFLNGEPLTPDSWTPKITQALSKTKAVNLVLVISGKDRLGSILDVVGKSRRLPVRMLVVEFTEEANSEGPKSD